MCGIAGLITQDGRGRADLLSIAAAMASTVRHRGPDDGGAWADEAAGVALGFRRLAILDLSEQGRQPMMSASERYVIVFNGEIYNFLALRTALEQDFALSFRGHSDTEVALAVIERDGIEGALEQLNGMFAIALWDRQERVLHLARDRFGEKPVYYGWCGRTFLFGSELKALRAHPDFTGEIDRDALALYFRFSYVPSPYSIYRNIYKLPAACWLTVKASALDDRPPAKPYWSARTVVQRSLAAPMTGSEDEAVTQLDTLLREAIGMRMVADVPVGALLSGGVDSSTVVSLMQAQLARPVKTFSIGFEEASHDEAASAKQVARALGTDHTELCVRPAEARAVIPYLPRFYDEPFADSSQIPTYLVSRLARRQVTVALSGDGGDELFGGYNRYFWASRLWRRVGWVPRTVRTLAGRGLMTVAPDTWEAVFGAIGPVLPRSLRVRSPGEKLHKLGSILGVTGPISLYDRLVATWPDPAEVVMGTTLQGATTLTGNSEPEPAVEDFRQWMMYRDSVTYLPDDILTKVDRASMATSLEVRVPFLDPRVYEFAWRLPLSMKVRAGRGKWLLRQVLCRYVSPRLIERPKMGFGIPIGAWLRGPLREWAAELVGPSRLRQEGFVLSEPIARIWASHLAGRGNWQYRLWTVLMFQAWLEETRRTERGSWAA